MSLRAFRWIAAGMLILACTAPAAAQVTGSIAGTVRDASGAVLPGATVTVKGPSLQRESVDGDGDVGRHLPDPAACRRVRTRSPSS